MIRRPPRSPLFPYPPLFRSLVSLPFVAAVGGIGSGGVRYAYLPHLTSEITGQFLSTQRGAVKLFSWSDPQETFPPDALDRKSTRLNSSHSQISYAVFCLKKK